jgi:FkbM family methyltransferase
MNVAAEATRGRWEPLLRAAAGCWQDARGWSERRALAGYMARNLLRRAGLGFDRLESRTIRLGGLELQIRPGSGELYLYQEIFRDLVYERHPAFALRAGWCLIDCGANIGMFSLRATRAGCAQVIAVEPDPETFARLEKNLERNAATTVTALASAVGRAPGRAAFQRSGASTLGRVAAREDSAASASSEIEVDVTTVAVVFDRYALRTVNLLKLDIEGAELDALEGARPVLDRIERIVMEYHGAGSLAACERLLARHGFARVAIVSPAYAYFAREWVS